MTAQTRNAMEATLLAIIARGVIPTRYKSNVGQFIDAGDKKIRLQNADNKLTPAGKAYWKLVGIPAPSLYNYDQGAPR